MLRRTVLILQFIVLKLQCCSSLEDIQSGFELSFGQWYPWDQCPTGSYAHAFEVEAKQEETRKMIRDEVGMTGMRLYCVGGDEEPTTIKSYNLRDEGTWRGKRSCPDDELVVGFRLRIDKKWGWAHDDTAGNDAAVVCTSGNVLEGGGNLRGTWQEWSYCTPGSAVCGIQTRVEDLILNLDKVGLVSARLRCCPLPNKHNHTDFDDYGNRTFPRPPPRGNNSSQGHENFNPNYPSNFDMENPNNKTIDSTKNFKTYIPGNKENPNFRVYPDILDENPEVYNAPFDEHHLTENNSKPNNNNPGNDSTKHFNTNKPGTKESPNFRVYPSILDENPDIYNAPFDEHHLTENNSKPNNNNPGNDSTKHFNTNKPGTKESPNFRVYPSILDENPDIYNAPFDDHHLTENNTKQNNNSGTNGNPNIYFVKAGPKDDHFNSSSIDGRKHDPTIDENVNKSSNFPKLSRGGKKFPKVDENSNLNKTFTEHEKKQNPEQDEQKHNPKSDENTNTSSNSTYSNRDGQRNVPNRNGHGNNFSGNSSFENNFTLINHYGNYGPEHNNNNSLQYNSTISNGSEHKNFTREYTPNIIGQGQKNYTVGTEEPIFSDGKSESDLNPNKKNPNIIKNDNKYGNVHNSTDDNKGIEKRPDLPHDSNSKGKPTLKDNTSLEETNEVPVDELGAELNPSSNNDHREDKNQEPKHDFSDQPDMMFNSSYTNKANNESRKTDSNQDKSTTPNFYNVTLNGIFPKALSPELVTTKTTERGFGIVPFTNYHDVPMSHSSFVPELNASNNQSSNANLAPGVATSNSSINRNNGNETLNGMIPTATPRLFTPQINLQETSTVRGFGIVPFTNYHDVPMSQSSFGPEFNASNNQSINPNLAPGVATSNSSINRNNGNETLNGMIPTATPRLFTPQINLQETSTVRGFGIVPFTNYHDVPMSQSSFGPEFNASNNQSINPNLAPGVATSNSSINRNNGNETLNGMIPTATPRLFTPQINLQETSTVRGFGIVPFTNYHDVPMSQSSFGPEFNASNNQSINPNLAPGVATSNSSINRNNGNETLNGMIPTATPRLFTPQINLQETSTVRGFGIVPFTNYHDVPMSQSSFGPEFNASNNQSINPNLAPGVATSNSSINRNNGNETLNGMIPTATPGLFTPQINLQETSTVRGFGIVPFTNYHDVPMSQSSFGPEFNASNNQSSNANLAPGVATSNSSINRNNGNETLNGMIPTATPRLFTPQINLQETSTVRGFGIVPFTNYHDVPMSQSSFGPEFNASNNQSINPNLAPGVATSNSSINRNNGNETLNGMIPTATPGLFTPQINLQETSTVRGFGIVPFTNYHDVPMSQSSFGPEFNASNNQSSNANLAPGVATSNSSINRNNGNETLNGMIPTATPGLVTPQINLQGGTTRHAGSPATLDPNLQNKVLNFPGNLTSEDVAINEINTNDLEIPYSSKRPRPKVVTNTHGSGHNSPPVPNFAPAPYFPSSVPSYNDTVNGIDRNINVNESNNGSFNNNVNNDKNNNKENDIGSYFPGEEFPMINFTEKSVEVSSKKGARNPGYKNTAEPNFFINGRSALESPLLLSNGGSKVTTKNSESYDAMFVMAGLALATVLTGSILLAVRYTKKYVVTLRQVRPIEPAA